MINLIREYLLKLVDNIDAGNSNLTERVKVITACLMSIIEFINMIETRREV